MSPAWIALALTAGLLALLLSPLEALEWWAGWFEGERSRRHPHRGFHLHAAPAEHPKALYLLFLDGIARAGTHENIRQVQRFLDALREALPEAEVIDDLFPYSVTGVPLTEQRTLSRLWRFADGRKRTARMSAVGFTINLRNLLQVAASSDRRYAPVYFQGEAQLLLNSLLQHGFDPRRPSHVVLVGYSGGAQMAMGAAAYLQRALRMWVRVINIGGVVSSHRLIDELARVDHLQGSRDLVERVGALAFPARWRLAPLSAWQRARREGRIRVHRIGPMSHLGAGSYVDDRASFEGKSHAQHTLEAVVALAREELAEPLEAGGRSETSAAASRPETAPGA